MILVTGSEGLLGRRLSDKLETAGLAVRRFDIRRSESEDIRHPKALQEAMIGVEGIVHLAAISRVVWAERHPLLARSVNVDPLRTLLSTALKFRPSPWVVFASSREVYGDSPILPVRDDAPFRPLNVYARSKVDGERMINESVQAGLLANICRFSNVYGDVRDHSDRVAIAFASASALGGTIRVEGANNMFDFTHIEDVADGIASVVETTRQKEQFPPLHFVSGQGVTLAQLAELAEKCCDAIRGVKTVETAGRDFDVTRFVGDPRRTTELLGWNAQISLADGFRKLVGSLRKEGLDNLERPWIDLVAKGTAIGDKV